MANVSAAEHRKQRRVGPSHRTRWIARAETLKNDRDFCRSIARFRRAWSATFPAFALGAPEWFPESGIVTTCRYIVVPPPITRLVDIHKGNSDPIPPHANQAWQRWIRAVSW